MPSFGPKEMWPVAFSPASELTLSQSKLICLSVIETDKKSILEPAHVRDRALLATYFKRKAQTSNISFLCKSCNRNHIHKPS